MLKLRATFDLRKDVFPLIGGDQDPAEGGEGSSPAADARLLNGESDGSILYSWKAQGATRIGKYEPSTRENKLLYAFDKEVSVSSCTINTESTLLAVTLTQGTQRDGQLKLGPKCLTLLIEIQPVNNTKVLKAVDCAVRVQFLHPQFVRSSVLDSHLLLVTGDGYVELFHIPLTRQEGDRVVIHNPDRLARERVAEELCWVQWDGATQRLFCLTAREKSVLKCVQFYPDCNCETLFEMLLDLPASPFSSMRFVNLGYDHYKDQKLDDEGINLVVFTSKAGSMSVCYSQPAGVEGVTYTIAFVHRGYSKTYTQEGTAHTGGPVLIFLQLGYYIMVYLADHFLHLINSQQQELPCFSFFLSGEDARLPTLGQRVEPLPHASLLDAAAGRVYQVELRHSFLLNLLWRSESDAQRLAAMHCLLGYAGPTQKVEMKVLDWICQNVMPLQTFDQIQEFILASLYRAVSQESPNLDSMETLPYSAVFERKDPLPDRLKTIAGVKCTSDLLPQPVFKGKARYLQGYWEELQWNMERLKYFEAAPDSRYRSSLIQNDCTKILAVQESEDKKSTNYLRHIEENTKKVLCLVDTWQIDKKVVPVFQGEDYQQRVLIGLMVDKLREHLIRHLPRMGKKKIDKLVVSYVARLLELVRHMLETMWVRFQLGPQVLSLKQPGSSAEWAVFHVMNRILEATSSLCLPLPPGYHTLLSALGVRCLPQHTFLQYVDHGLLQLTESFVSRLMTDLDNSPENEKLKFSIMKRLPAPLEQKVCHLWDHPVTSACISRMYVKDLLDKRVRGKVSSFEEREKSSSYLQFLPLSYLAKILSDVESQATNPFEQQENVDSKFVEETALKQTLLLLGYEDK